MSEEIIWISQIFQELWANMYWRLEKYLSIEKMVSQSHYLRPWPPKNYRARTICKVKIIRVYNCILYWGNNMFFLDCDQFLKLNLDKRQPKLQENGSNWPKCSNGFPINQWNINFFAQIYRRLKTIISLNTCVQFGGNIMEFTDSVAII